MAAEKVELAEAYVSIIPTLQGVSGNIQGQLERGLAAPAQRAGAAAGTSALKGMSQTMTRGTAKLGKDIGLDFVKSMNIAGYLDKEETGVRKVATKMGRSFVDGFRSAEAAASGFTGTIGTVGGQVRVLADRAAQPGLNFVSGFRDASAAASSFSGHMGSLGGVASRAYTAAARPAQNFISGFREADAASSALTGRMGTLGGAAQRAYSTAARPVQNFISGFRDADAAGSALTGRMGTVGGAAQRLTSQASGLAGRIAQPVRNLVSGFRDADSAASDTTGRMGTLGGVLSRAGGSISTYGGQVRAAFGGIGDRIGDATLKVGEFGLKAGAVLGGVGAVIAGMALTGGINRALAIENSEAKLIGLGHSAQTVEGIMDNALASVKGTSFGLGEAASTAAGAVAAGIQPGQELEGVLKTVANSAAIAGTDMTSMGTIFNKVAATGKIQGDEILQLSEAGIPVLAFLSKELGKTSAEVSEMASKGEIDFATFERAMKTGVGTAAEEMGKTTSGSFANLKAAMGRLGAEAVTPLLPLVTELFGKLTAGADWLAKYVGPAFTEIAGGIRAFGAAWSAANGDVTSIGFAGAMERLANAGIWAKDAVTDFVQSIPTPVFAAIGGAVGLLAARFGGAALATQQITGRFAFLTPLVQRLGGALKFLGGPWGLLIGLITSAVSQSQPLQDMLLGIGRQFLDAGRALYEGLVPAFTELMQNSGPALTDFFGQLVGAVGGLLEAVLPLVSQLLAGLLPVVIELVTSALPPLIGIISTLAGAFMAALPSIVSIATTVLQVLTPALEWVIGAVSAVLDVLGGPLGTVAGIAVGAFVAMQVGLWLLSGAITAVTVASGILAGVWAVMTSPITLIVAGIALLVGGLILAYNKIGWFKTAVDATWAGIVTAAQWLWGALQTVLGAIGTAFAWLYTNAIAPTFAWIQAAAAGVVTWFQTTLVPFFQAALAAVGAVFTWLYQAIILPVWGFIQAAIGVAATVINAVLTGIMWVVQNVLAPVFTWFYNVIIAPIWNLIRWAIEVVATIIINIFQAIGAVVTKILAPAFTYFYYSVIVPVWNGIRNAIATAWNFISGIFWTAVNFVRGALATAFTWFRDSVITPVWNFIQSKINAVVSFIRNTILQPLINWVTGYLMQQWTYFKIGLGLIWDNISSKINAVVNWVRTRILQPLINWVSGTFLTAWRGFRDLLGGIWDNVSDKIRGTVDFIRDRILAPVGDYVKTTFVDAWTKAKDLISKAWEGLQDAVKKPIKFVVDTVINKGFIDNFNKINDFWDGKDIPKLNLGFRHGGYTGRGGKWEPAGIVHKGEGVIKQESTDRLLASHGMGALNYLNETGDLVGAAAMGRKGAASGREHEHAAGPGTNVGGGYASFSNKLQHDVYRERRLSVHNAGTAARYQLEKATNSWNGLAGVELNYNGAGPRVNARSGNMGAWWAGYYDNHQIRLNDPGANGLSGSDLMILTAHEIGHALGLTHRHRAEGGDNANSIMNYDKMYGKSGPTSADQKSLQAIYPGKPGQKFAEVGDNGEGGGIIGWLVDRFVDPVLKLIDEQKRAFGDKNSFAEMPFGIASKAVGNIRDWVVEKFGGGEDPGGEGVERWRDTVKRALKHTGVPDSDPYVEAWLRQIQTESGGNPKAIQQVVDVNTGGNEAAGLVQVTKGTWDAYRDKSLPDDRFNAFANLVAGINWSKAAYGIEGMLNVIGHGHGYSGGGLVSGDDEFSRLISANYTPEELKPLLFDGGGWLHNTGAAQVVAHRTRQPDAVLPMNRWRDLHDTAESVRNGQTGRGDTYVTVQERPERSIENMARRMSEALADELRTVGA